RRSGFTREYGSGDNGEQRVGIGQQGRPFRGRTRAYEGLRPITDLCPPPIRRRSGFTREYGSGDNGEQRVGIGQQGRPFRGRTRAYEGLRPIT
ncbi:hypothetical protein, partial [Pseudomonas hunanensis]|uniref:hypothetical protein n=1 Tax=Pseudomonas hunanensis TaxID=1247546 RepID=UPI0030D99B28